ncbi:glycosyltransferase [Streptomyces nogalater]
MWDHFYRARRLEELGAGLRLPSGELTAEGLRTRLERVLGEPSFGTAAQALSDTIAAEPSPSEVVPVLEELTGRHRPGTREPFRALRA